MLPLIAHDAANANAARDAANANEAHDAANADKAHDAANVRRARPRSVDDRDFVRRPFSTGERRVVHALAEVIFSEERPEGLLVPARPELSQRLTGELERMVGAGSSDLRRGYRVLIWIIEWLPLFVIGAFSRASRLPIARRLTYLEALERSKIGLLAALLVAFKIPLTMLGYELEPELFLSGFDRPTTATRRRLPAPTEMTARGRSEVES